MSIDSKRKVSNAVNTGPVSKAYSEVKGGDINSAAGVSYTDGKAKEATKNNANKNGGGVIKALGNDAVRAARNQLNTYDDTGVQAAVLGADAIKAGASAYSTVTKASPYIMSGTAKGIKGIANGVRKSVQVSNKIKVEVEGIVDGRIKLDSATLARYKSAAARGIMTIPPIKRAIVVARKIHHGAVRLKTGVVKSYKVVKGVFNGTIKLQITKAQIERLKTNVNKIDKQALAAMNRFAGKAAIGTFRATGGALQLGYTGLERSSEGSDDTGIQATALALKSGRYAARGIQTAPKVIMTTSRAVRTSIKTVDKAKAGVKSTYNMARKFGIKEMLKFNRQRAAEAIKNIGKNLGKNVIKGIASLAKGLLGKAIIPVLICIVVVVAAMSAASGAVGVIGTIFGGIFSPSDDPDKGDVAVHEFLGEKLEKSREELTEKIDGITEKALTEDGYDVVHVFVNNDKSKPLPSVDEFVAMLEPIYHILLLNNFELTPTKTQADALYKEIWDATIALSTRELPIEYCSDPCGTCGIRHSIGGCPKNKSGSHVSYTCSSCCYDYLCDGNEITDKPHASGEHRIKGCSYRDCQGHRVLGIFVDIKTLDELLDKYFLTEIRQLEALGKLTPKQQQRLGDLKNNYQLCKSFAEEFERKLKNGEF